MRTRTAASAEVTPTLESGAKAPVERPLLFLDVDGVLNVFPGHEECAYHDTEGGRVHIAPGTRERVLRLLEAFDPVWATAWLGGAHRTFRPLLGLSELPWEYVSYSDLKLPRILRMAGERPWAFVDDDADWELEKLGWTRDTVAGLVLNPDTSVGLTDDHVDELVAWASGLGPQAPSRPEVAHKQESPSVRRDVTGEGER